MAAGAAGFEIATVVLELVDPGSLPAVEMEHLELMSERAAVRSSKCKNVSSDPGTRRTDTRWFDDGYQKEGNGGIHMSFALSVVS